MKYEIPKCSNPEIDAEIIKETRRFNSQFVPDDFSLLSIYCRSEHDVLIGGLTGKTYWNYLDIEYLWVDETVRGEGLGSRIIKLAETEAKQRGCLYSILDTYAFQAIDFYLKQGYGQFGQLQEFHGKYDRYYLRKQL